ncbi:MAG: hypothetical protein HY318_03030 [Armatimonadetes bacterium]|nr:hypothetical protein [Armatimonadota bacterium]
MKSRDCSLRTVGVLCTFLVLCGYVVFAAPRETESRRGKSPSTPAKGEVQPAGRTAKAGPKARSTVAGKPGPAALKTASTPATTVVVDSLTLKESTTLTEFLKAVQARTGAQIKVDDSAKAYAATYTFPPYLAGTKVDIRKVPEAMNFITRGGWEGSKLSETARDRAGPNYMLAHAPISAPGSPRRWVCNNRCWDWTVEKELVTVALAATAAASTKKEPTKAAVAPKGKTLVASTKPATTTVKQVVVVKFRKRVADDGDVTVTQPVALGNVKDDYTLRTTVELLKAKAGVAINIVGSEFAPAENPGGVAPKLVPMAMRSIPLPLRAKLDQPITVGNALSILAAGLNLYTGKSGGDWKWSSYQAPTDDDGNRQVIYTLRDYGRV